jgi:hypothetical protein
VEKGNQEHRWSRPEATALRTVLRCPIPARDEEPDRVDLEVTGSRPPRLRLCDSAPRLLRVYTEGIVSRRACHDAWPFEEI